MFYFGFLVWALPTNLLVRSSTEGTCAVSDEDQLQRLPVGKYLGFNIFLWGAFLMLQAISKVQDPFGVD